MDISSIAPKVKASTVPFDRLAANPNVSQKDKVKEACRQFEAVLVRQILTEARKSVIPNSGADESNEAGVYNDMINNQMADCISRSGSFGLAKSLETQLVNQILPKTADKTSAAPAGDTAVKTTRK